MKIAVIGRIMCILVIGYLSQSAYAQLRDVNYAKSTLQFTVTQMGVPVDGSFRKFAAKLVFDPANIAGASAQIDIDMGSGDTGSEEGDTEVKRKAWFNLKEFPTAKFVSSSVRKKGNNQYEALGKLSIKGKARDVVLPFTVTDDGAGSTLAGQFTLKRIEFAIGDGPWNDPEVVADEVIVKYRLALSPLKQ
jgi:polyisoprenoid-binding protein YceI